MHLEIKSAILCDQLCLTFDDGPGNHTEEIGTYLYEQGIPATFFLIGSFIAGNEDVVQRLLDQGHEIGNHTQRHPVLDTPDQVREEIMAAHEQLRRFVDHGERPLFFRPPYGWWPASTDFYDAVVENGVYVGPVSWDFSGDDWRYWEQATSADDDGALSRAVTNYAQARQGIVLMHDHSFEKDIACKSQTYRMIKKLVPLWQQGGVSFVRLRDAYTDGLLKFRR